MRKYVLGVCLVLGSCAIFAAGLRDRLAPKGQAAAAGLRLSTTSPVSTLPLAGLPTARSESPSGSRIAIQYSKLPLAFEPNVGQSDNETEFLARGDGYSLLLAPGESRIILKPGSNRAKAQRGAAGEPGHSAFSRPNAPKQQAQHGDRFLTVLRMRLAGANKTAHLTALDELPGKTNYVMGNTPANWHVNVPNYRQVEERGVYSGVDLRYYGTQRQLEYDFLVAPGADSTVIRISFQGAQTLRTDPHGDLVISTAGEDVRLRKPVAYQESAAGREIVAANYVLSGEHEVAFRLGAYDSSRALVIDPILSYSTYVGGSNIDGATAIAIAPDNTAFITGGTYSLDFPTAHPLQPNHGGPDDFSRDAFVTKISADGSTLLYSTYLGGKNEDVGNGIAVDTFGDAFVTGTTLSPDFPVTPGSFNTECGGDAKCGASFNTGGLIVSNGFVTKLNPAGSAIVYSGFVGSFENVKCFGIGVDNDGIAYVTGQTEANGVSDLPIPAPPAPPPPQPPPFPITVTAFQPFFGGGATDAFVLTISATGSVIQYASYLGGSDEDASHGIAVDNIGNAYLTGLSYSINFPRTATALQLANAGAGDAFFAKVNTRGVGLSSLSYSTFLGGNGLDQGNAVAVDSLGNAYLTGGTASKAATLGFTPPLGGFQPNCTSDSSGNCEGDAFAAKFNPAASGSASLIYFTYLGGKLADSGQGIAVDPVSPPSGNAYVTGSTVSTDFPATTAAFQSNFGGGNADAFVAKLDPLGATLLYSSYLGGTNTDTGNGIAVDTSGSAYVAGQTCSFDFPLANPVQASPGGNCDAFVSKVTILSGLQLNPAGLVFPAQSLGTTSQSQTVTLTNGDNPTTIASITLTGANVGDFAETNTCAASLAPGDRCSITVTFTPLAAGIRKAAVTITDSATGSPHLINLSGQSSTLTLSASSLSFGNQQVGLKSQPQPITATNNGTTALTFSSITASGDYAETDNCTKAPLQPTTTCSINVTFAPTAAGSSIGGLTLTDNAPGSPQVVLLSGIGNGQLSDFTLSSVQPGEAIPAGQSANFTLLMSAVGGFNQPVTLSCSGLPRAANCLTTANPVTPTGSTPLQIPLTITTGNRAVVSPGLKTWQGPSHGSRYFVLGLIGLALVFILASFAGARLRLATATFGVAVILLLASAGCNSGNQAGVPAGTPAGTYQITVIGTSGATTHTIVVNLQVK